MLLNKKYLWEERKHSTFLLNILVSSKTDLHNLSISFKVFILYILEAVSTLSGLIPFQDYLKHPQRRFSGINICLNLVGTIPPCQTPTLKKGFLSYRVFFCSVSCLILAFSYIIAQKNLNVIFLKDEI